MAPQHIEAALQENVRLKLEILNISKESKKMKKLVMQQDRNLAEAQRERDGAAGVKGANAESQRKYEDEKARRKALEAELDELKGSLDDVQEELSKVVDRADKAEEELERMQSGAIISEEVEDVSGGDLDLGQRR